MTRPPPHRRAGALWRALVAVAMAAAAGATHAAPLEVRVLDAAGRPLSGAVVFVESREAQAAVRPARQVEIVQVDRRFDPPVTVVPVGTAVSFPNRDTVRHHVYSFSPAKRFEIKLYVGTPASPVVFDRPGIAVLGCNIHDRMAAWVVIVPTPWHARSGADGMARLPDVPPGLHRLRVWHPDMPVGAPALEQPLQVAPAGARAQVVVAEAAR